MRQRLVTARTAIINQLRGLMRERGIVAPGGRARFERFVRDQLLGGDVGLSPVSRALFATLVGEYETISARLAEIDQELEAFARENPICRALLPIPGIGYIVATALYSAVANISDFQTGRDLAAFLGLVPETTLDRRQDRPARHLQARQQLCPHAHDPRHALRLSSPRPAGQSDDAVHERLVKRGLHTNKIVVASANKAARIVWAVFAKNETYRPAA